METASIDLRTSAIDASWKFSAEHTLFHLLASANELTGLAFDTRKKKFVFMRHFVCKDRWNWTNKFLYEFFPFSEHSAPKIFIDSCNATLIPDSVFGLISIEEVFKTTHQVKADDIIKTERLIKQEANLIYTVSKEEQVWLNEYFPGKEYTNASVAWLDGLLTQYKGEKENHVHLDFYDGGFQVAAFKNEALVLYNSFTAKSPEDKLYFILFVSEQLKINPKKDAYYFSGSINRNDEIHIMLRSYLKESKMQPKPAFYNYSLPFHAITESSYYKAFCSPLCVL